MTSETGRRLAELDTIEVAIEKLVAGGDGLARFEKIPIFVPRSAPGDRLRVRLVERRASFGRAEIEEILEPGPGRREPPCSFFDRCGGCDLQHLDETKQLQYKVQAVRENLLRLGGIETPASIKVIAGKAWGYRVRAQLHIAETERGHQIGYFARGSHDLVPVDSCPVLVPELESALPVLQRSVREGPPHRRLEITAGSDQAWTCAPAFDDLPRGEVSTTVGDFTFRYDATCFFQGHRHLLAELVDLAVGTGDGAGESSEEDAFDLYSGVGLFSLPLSRKYRKVVAVEGERNAARFARRNQQLNGVENLQLENQAVEGWAGKLPTQAARVVVDPPRVGLSRKVREVLLSRRPHHLTYVSCDSATLARDLRELREWYEVRSLALIDLFPQTGHLEVIAQLFRRDLSATSSGEPRS